MIARLPQRAVRAGALAAAAWLAAACAPSPEELASEQQAVVNRYCTECHDAVEQEAGLVLEDADLLNTAANPAVWEKVIHKLDIGLMPPPGGPRPDAQTAAGLVAYLETALDAAASAAPKPGRQPLHRLNRAEYGNAIRDLLGFTVDVESLLPADSSSHGFDNVSDVLKTSPLLLERYLTVGMRVAALAVGDTTVEPRSTQYAPRPDLSQNRWIEGLPLGTRGGLVVDHYFPVDAQYEFRPELWEAAASTVRGLEGFTTPFEYEMLLDGVPVHRATIGGVEDDALSNRDQGSATTAAQGALGRNAAGNRRRPPARPYVRDEELRDRATGAATVRKRFAARQRRVRLAAHRARAGHGTVRADRARRHAGAARDLRVRSDGRRGARRLRGAHPEPASRARPTAGRSPSKTSRRYSTSTHAAARAAETSSAASSLRSRAS